MAAPAGACPLRPCHALHRRASAGGDQRVPADRDRLSRSSGMVRLRPVHAASAGHPTAVCSSRCVGSGRWRARSLDQPPSSPDPQCSVLHVYVRPVARSPMAPATISVSAGCGRPTGAPASLERSVPALPSSRLNSVPQRRNSAGPSGPPGRAPGRA